MRGIDLKLKRIGRRVLVKDLAEVMDVPSSYISALERRDIVTEKATAKYLAALSKFEKVA